MYAIAPAGVLRLADGVLIRRSDPGWSDYLEWLSAGGIPDPIPESLPTRSSPNFRRSSCLHKAHHHIPTRPP